MKRRTLTIFLLLFGAAWPISFPVFSADAPQSKEAKQIMALVDKAAALIESKGKAAFAEFKKKGSEWYKGDTYVFVNDMKGVSLVNPAFPEFEGKNNLDLKDADGKAVTREFIALLKTKESGWVEYMWPKPGEKKPSKKSLIGSSFWNY